jgi:hypothetical protein
VGDAIGAFGVTLVTITAYVLAVVVVLVGVYLYSKSQPAEEPVG